MSFDQRPLSRAQIIVRPDLTFVVIFGEEVIEFHFSPEEAFEIAGALNEAATAFKLAAILKAPAK